MADQPTALVPYEAFKNELVARQDEIAALLPSTITKEAFVNTAIIAVKGNPDLLECDRRSLHKAVTAAAHDGMKPDAREGVILPQKEKVTVDGRETWIKTARWQPMAFGIRKRARELDGIVIDAQVVHEHDRFEWSQGDDARIVHVPAPLGTDRGKAVGAYAIFKKGDTIVHREVMGLPDIEAVRAISKQPNGLMWGKFWGEAAKKTVLRRGSKSVPCSDALRTVLERDDDLYDVADRAHDVTPAARRLAPVKGPAIMVTWRPGEPMEQVPIKEFAARAGEFIRSAEAAAVANWTERNRHALREFWQADKDAALALKAEIEKVAARQEPRETPHEQPQAAAVPANDGPVDDCAQLPLEAAEAEADDRETIVRDLLAELQKADPARRKSIWRESERARGSLTDAQAARLKAALDQMELQAGKPARGKQAA